MSSGLIESTLPKKEKLGFPFLLLCAYFFLDYVRPQDLFPFLNSLHLGVVFALMLGMTWLIRGKKDFSNGSTILFGFLLIIMAKSIPIARNNYWALRETVILLMIFVFYYLFIVSFLDSSKRIRTFLYVFVLLHIFLSYMAIRSHGQGIGNFLKDENDFSLAINMVIPYSLFLSQDEKESRKRRIVFLLATLLLVAANVATLSRGGFVGMVAIFLYFVAMAKKKMKVAAIMIILFLSTLFFVRSDYIDEIRTIGRHDPETWDTGDVRLYLWRLSWNMFLDNPILGIGPGNFQWNIQDYETIDMKNPMLSASRGGKVAHSLYFTLLPELALPGVIVFGMMILRNFGSLRATTRLIKEQIVDARKGILVNGAKMDILKQTHLVNKILVGSMVGYLVSGAFLSVLYYPHFWILTALGVASMNNFRRLFYEKEESENRGHVFVRS